MLDAKPTPATRARAQAPGRRWRNYFRIYRVLHMWRSGPIFPGVHRAPRDFDTQENAERFAANMVAAINKRGPTILDFAGAYPEGDAPN